MINRVLVCVTGQKTCENLIDQGSIIAKKKAGTLTVVHVAQPNSKFLDIEKDGEALEYLFAIAKNYDADMAMLRSDDVPETIATFAEKKNITHLVLGSSTSGSNTAIAQRLKERLPNVNVQLVIA